MEAEQLNAIANRLADLARTQPPTCGGIFDYDAKQERLTEVVQLLEDPAVWNDAKRAQELGKERRELWKASSTR